MNARNISIAILLAVLVFVGGYVFWQSYDKGSLTVTLQAPFTFQLDTSDPLPCTAGSCTIQTKPGNHDLLITKDGYANYFAQVSVIRGETAQIHPELDRIPNLTTQKNVMFTLPTRTNPFTLTTNKDTGVQTLKKKSSDSSGNDEIIAYFSRPLTTPKIITDDAFQHIWIIDTASGTQNLSTIYLIDVAAKTRTNIYETTEVVRDLAPSPGGTSLLVLTANHIDVIKNTSQVAEKLPANVDSSSLIAWKDETNFFMMDHDATSNSLKRVNLAITSATAKNSQIATIQTWPLSAEKIAFIIFDQVKKQLQIQGKKTAYMIQL